ncbi:MAG: spore coat associated protein CotJA [Clostridiales bacterium]|nr:spore coat associated protein CotJA [Clostridiales bacterium]
MYRHKMKKVKCYARSYVELQVYENLYTVKDAIKCGTIFKDLYSPYKKISKSEINCMQVKCDE